MNEIVSWIIFDKIIQEISEDNFDISSVWLEDTCMWKAKFWNIFKMFCIVHTILSLLEAPSPIEAPLNGSSNCHKIVAPPQNRRALRF